MGKGLWDKVKKVAGAPAMAIKTAASGGDIRDVIKAGGQGSVGGQVISAVSGNPDSLLSKMASGDFGGAADAAKSHKADKAKALADEMAAKENDQYGQNQAYSKQLAGQDTDYLGRMDTLTKNRQSDIDDLRKEVGQSQTEAGRTYSNDIQPRMKGLMEDAQKNAAGAMSLQDAMNPNNKVAAGARALYSDEGAKQRGNYNSEAANTRNQYNQQGAGIQQQYERQAQNEGKQGLADAGVLSALGMQNMAGQLGGVPMSGGQLQALMGANQAQTGAAYSKTLQRGQNLRDQGIQGNIGRQSAGLDSATSTRNAGLGRQADLGTQGLAQGFNRSDIAYGQGLQAQDRYRGSVGDYEGAADRQLGRDKDFRGQRDNMSGQTYGLQQQMNDANRGAGNAATQRDMAIYNTHMGGGQANIAGQIGQLNAQQARDAQMQTGAMSAAGTVAGAYFGGPAGAAAGGQAGQQIGQANAPQTNAVPQYGNYGASQPTMQQQQMGIQNYMNQSGPQNYSYGGNGAQMGPPATSYAGSSGGSQGVTEGGQGLGLFGSQNPYDNRRAARPTARSMGARA